MPENLKQCIACAELIKPNAILCRHCGTRQDDPQFLDEVEVDDAVHGEETEPAEANASSGPEESSNQNVAWVVFIVFALFLLVFVAGTAPQSSVDSESCGEYLKSNPIATFNEFDTTSVAGTEAGFRKWSGLMKGWFGATDNEPLRAAYNEYIFTLDEYLFSMEGSASELGTKFSEAEQSLNLVCERLVND